MFDSEFDSEFDFYGYFYSIGLIDDLDKARRDRLKNLFLDLFLLIDDLDPEEKISGLRGDFLALIVRYFNNGKPVIERVKRIK